MNSYVNRDNTVKKDELFKNLKPKKSSQKTTTKKISKTGNKSLMDKRSSYNSSKKETNINIENPPNEVQMKQYDNIVKEGMNTRVDIFKTKEHLVKLEKDLELKNKQLEIATKEKKNFQKYLSKLEKIIHSYYRSNSIHVYC